MLRHLQKIKSNMLAKGATSIVTAIFLVLSPIAAVTFTGNKAYAAPDFQMPFPCGETWWASTYSNHYAIDWNDMISGDDGRIVVASLSGTATASYSPGYGNYVLIDHGGGWKTRYAHLKVTGVSGAVDQGDYIGKVGNTGNSEGSHLHWEQIYNGQRQGTLYANGNALQPGTSYNASDPKYTSSNDCEVVNDIDNDGVLNAYDLCPSQAGSPYANGCPDTGDASPSLSVGNADTLYSLHVGTDHCARIYKRGAADPAFSQLAQIASCTWTTAGTSDMAMVPGTDDQAWFAMLEIINPEQCAKLYLFKMDGSTVTNQGHVGTVACGWSKASPPSVALDPEGNVYIVSTKSGSAHVFKRALDGTIALDETVGYAGSWSDYSGVALEAGPDGTLWLVGVKKAGSVWTVKRELDGTWVTKGELGSSGWSTNAKPAVAVDNDGDITVALVQKGTSGAGLVKTYRRCATCIKWHSVGQIGSQAWSSEGTFGIAAAPDDKAWLSVVKHQDSGADMYSYMLTPDPTQNHLGTWTKIGKVGSMGDWSPFTAPSVAVSETGTPYTLGVKINSVMYATDYNTASGWTSHGQVGNTSWAGASR